MSKHAKELESLGELKLNQLLALGIKLGGTEQVRKLLQCDVVTVNFAEAEKAATVSAEKPAVPVLTCAIQKVLPARDSRFDPQEYFKTGPGLYARDDFANRIRKIAKSVDSVPGITVMGRNLTQNATDAQIRAELPDDHVFEDTSEFCAHLAGMIERQPNGADGALLNNGYANIFYVRGKAGEVFAVYVYWFAVGRYWSVAACALDDFQWYAGYRVFSRTAAA